MSTWKDDDERILGGESAVMAPFTLPLVRSADGLTGSGERLLRFAHRPHFDWANDPDASSWQSLLERLKSGGAEEPVDGDLDALWRCLLATFRQDRLVEGLVAEHQVALARLGNELRRRVSARIAAGLHPPHEVRAVDGVVEASSAVRLPFEGRGWRHRFLEDLKGALGALEVKPGHVLSAVYGAEHDGEFVDVENVLFYNVGTGAFAPLCSTGLRFERSFEPPPLDERAFFPLRHHLRYRQVDVGTPFDHWAPATTLARWDDVPVVGFSSSMKPAVAWWAMRQARIESRPASTDQVFGLRLVVHGAGTGRSLAGVMKPLFDGVIAAFHGWDGSRDEEVASRLAAQLGVTPAEVHEHLFESRANALTPRVLVRRHGEQVSWNPQDELCLAGELLAGSPHGPTRLEGELFTLRACPRAWW